MCSITSCSAYARAEVPAQFEACRLGDGHPHVAREPRVGHVRGPDAEGKAPQGAGHAGVAVGADDQLSRQCELLDDHVVADGLRADELPVAVHLAVDLHVGALCKVVLHGGELARLHVEPHVLVGLGHDEIEEREVVAEGEDALRLGHLGVGAEALTEESIGHRRDVLVRETHVGPGEERVSRLDRLDTGAGLLCASTMTWEARIFSGRASSGAAASPMIGGETSPARRALL